MLKEAKIKEEEYQERIRNLIGDIVKAAFTLKDLKKFLDEIVKLGEEVTESKSCSIFLLDEDEHTLRIYAASGDVGKKLKDKKAKYYIPKRNPF